jgi:ATP-dependent RNA helicase DeaD
VDPRESRLLKLFERHTKGRIDVARVPTVADLRARRLELTRAALAEAIKAGGLERYRPCVDALAKDHDLMDVALAAVKLAHQAAGGDREEDEEGEGVEDFGGYDRDERPRRGGYEERGGRDERPARGDRPQRAERGPREERAPREERVAREDRDRGPTGATARVYVGAGRNAGVRPQDLVGAIANEAGIEGHRIGSIQIEDKYSVVELPEEWIDRVVKAMAKSTVKGKKASIRRFVES